MSSGISHDRADRAEREAATAWAFSGVGTQGALPRPFEFRLVAETYRKDKRSLPGDFSNQVVGGDAREQGQGSRERKARRVEDYEIEQIATDLFRIGKGALAIR